MFCERILILSLLTFLLFCWTTVQSQSTDDEQTLVDKANRLAKYSPDLRLVLNGLLRYENSHSKRPDDTYRYPLLHIASRSKSSPQVDDPMAAALATGFLGSRGKRNDYDEIPVFANGFPAGRG